MTKIYHSIHLILTIIFLLVLQQANAQKAEGILKGKIITGDSKPAAFVTIELKKLNRLAFSDNNGFFVLNHLPAIKDSLIISSVESEVYSQEIQLEKPQTIDFGIIRLRESVPQLQTVEIAGTTKQSYKSDYSFS